MFYDFLRDLRHAARWLRTNPAFTIVVVLMLGLGIGANTAVFSVMNTVVLRYLPVPNPQQLVYLKTTGMPEGSSQTGEGNSSFTVHTFEQLRRERQVFSDLMAFVPLALDRTAVRYGAEPEEAYADMVSGNFFSGLGVRTICGRAFTTEDETSHAQVAMLSHGYWRRRFGATCSAVGRMLYVRGVPFTIVGVTAADFIGVETAKATDLWIPLQDRIELNAWGMGDQATLYAARNWWCIMMMGRLAPAVSEKEALAKMNPMFQRAAYETLGSPKQGEKPPNLYFVPARGVAGLQEAEQPPSRF